MMPLITTGSSSVYTQAGKLGCVDISQSCYRKIPPFSLGITEINSFQIVPRGSECTCYKVSAE